MPKGGDFEDATYSISSVINIECTSLLKSFQPVANVLETVRPVVVHVLAQSWDESDLPGVVEKAAIKAGMERVYAD